MAIDKKHISNSFYTVLTNSKTGKVTLMAYSVNTELIGKCLNKFNCKLLLIN
jgi:hypothetical protein